VNPQIQGLFSHGTAELTPWGGRTLLEGDLFGVTVASDVDASVWEVDFTGCAAPAQSCVQDGRTWSANAAAGIRAPGVGGTLITFSHDPVSGGPHAVASRTNPQGTTSYSYDAVGNLVGDSDGISLGWDARNRLVAWSDGTDEYAFAYDAAGERVSRDDGTLTTVFLGDVEIDSTGEARTYFSFNGQTVAIRTTSGSTSTLEVVLADHLGSPQVTFDPASGAVTGTRLHRPYGDTRDESGVLPGGRGYTGQQTDPSGLMYYSARYYTPELMTFVSADTIVADESRTQDLNRYGYVRANPVRYSDPTGHCVPTTVQGRLGDPVSVPVGTSCESDIWGWVGWFNDIDNVVTVLGWIATGVCVFSTGGACVTLAMAAWGARSARAFQDHGWDAFFPVMADMLFSALMLGLSGSVGETSGTLAALPVNLLGAWGLELMLGSDRLYGGGTLSIAATRSSDGSMSFDLPWVPASVAGTRWAGVVTLGDDGTQAWVEYDGATTVRVTLLERPQRQGGWLAPRIE